MMKAGKKHTKRLLALLLGLVLVWSLVPTAGLMTVAFADDPDFVVSTGVSGDVANGSVSLSPEQPQPGTTVTVTAVPADGFYLAQLRYSIDEGESYTALVPSGGAYGFEMPEADVDIQADFVPIIWDGSIDVTWYNREDSVFTLYYPAQVAGLAAITNGIFTTYPTTPRLDENGEPEEQIVTGGGSRGIIMLPSYGAYQEGMGVQLPDGIEPDTDDDTVYASHLYGEFSSDYRLNDSQVDYSQRTDIISATTRVIGESAWIVAKCSTGSTGANNQVTTNDYYIGADDFHDKTVLIGADMDFGATKTGDYWDTDSPLYMPIGGQYSILPGDGYTNGWAKLSSSFCGTFDGQGHSFSNIYCERYANTEYGDSSTIGVIGRLGVHDNDPAEIRPFNPTVRRLVVESGLFSGRRSVAAIVGKIGQTSMRNGDGSIGGIIELCINKADIRGTDAKGAAGICAASWNGGVVQFCANFGSIISIYPDPAGGIAGYNEIGIRNCYNVGFVTAAQARFAMGIGSNNGGNYPITDCYWLTGKSVGGGYYNPPVGSSVSEFGTGTAITTLTAALLNNTVSGAIWYDDTTGINAFEGTNYPVLFYQLPGLGQQTYDITLVQPSSGGTISSTVESGMTGDTIQLGASPDAGYILDYFLVNGAQISGNSFMLAGNATVTAVFKQLRSATLTIEDCTDKPYTIEITKTGLVVAQGITVLVVDAPVASGDTVYESDVLTITPTFKENAVPEDVDRTYTGFSGLIRFGTVLNSYTVGVPRTLNALDMTNAGLGNDTILVSATAQTSLKDWKQVADISWYDPADPQTAYTLTTPEQLAGIALLVNNTPVQVTDFSGVTLTLGNDISLANNDGTTGTRLWVPVGTASGYAFKGTFDGAGHSITEMTVSRSTSSSYNGLFGYTVDARIEDLTVSGTVTGGASTGGLVGRADTTVISGVTSEVVVTGASQVGGVVGYTTAQSSVSTSVNFGAVRSTTGSGNPGLGGIVGYASATTISSSHNEADITAGGTSDTSRVGGIAGSLASGSSVTDSYNLGGLSGVSGPVGGIAGYVQTGSVTDSYNLGGLSGVSGPVGGIVGNLASTAASGNTVAASVTDCYNRGSVSGATGSVGGIVGSMSGSKSGDNIVNALIANCYTTGAVSLSGASGYRGAVVGNVVGTTAAATYNSVTNTHYLSAVPGSTNTPFGRIATGVTTVAATSQDSAALKALAPTLGSEFKEDGTTPVNEGYPVLAWQQTTPPELVGPPQSGDLDGDGVVTMTDALLAVYIAMGAMPSASDAVRAAADVDGDSQVSITDVILIIQQAL
jgi:hypothetical protein